MPILTIKIAPLACRRSAAESVKGAGFWPLVGSILIFAHIARRRLYMDYMAGFIWSRYMVAIWKVNSPPSGGLYMDSICLLSMLAPNLYASNTSPTDHTATEWAHAFSGVR